MMQKQHGLKPILLGVLLSVVAPVYAASGSRPWLGVHLGMSSDRQAAALTEVVGQLAGLGINTIIVEVNYGFEYQSHPELRGPNPCTKEQIGKLVAECKKHHVRLIPQFQCLGHQSWSRNTAPFLAKYPQFDETPGLYPENKGIYCRSWCPLNPEVNPIIFSLMDELIDAFQADALHVGMDEVFLIGEDACPRCKGKDKAELFAKAVNDYHQHLVDEKHVEMLMWADRFIDSTKLKFGKWEGSENGTARAIDLVPKDIIMCDWHYELRPAYESVPMFLEKGFRVWPASWKKPDAAQAFVDYSLTQQSDPRMLGHLNTTWGAVLIRDLPKFEPLMCATNSFRQKFVVLHDPPERGQPGDEMVQEYLKRQTQRIDDTFPLDYASPEHWKSLRDRYKQEYFYMLGLSPMAEKTPLKPTITGTLEGDGYVVDLLHYQSRPRLYVTANLYRPPHVEPCQRLPAVLYVCGHSYCGRNGNKTAYQSHGIWFARHGYICLVLDSLQLGEIAGVHHGTYREGRWWWHSRGYTPAGVECLNGIRGIDYLISRPDVDPERIAVTGISGGGAATHWIAAADERVKVAVPVSGMADLTSYVSHRVINGHCDCMFLYNTFQWPWTRIPALIAPRPLLFVNSDRDDIFPMDANQRVINHLKRIYSLYGASDFVDSVVSIGGHAYRQDIRQAAYRFINMHLKNDARVVTDSEVDLVTGPADKPQRPIPAEKLRVFPQDSDIPKDQLNTTIDRVFVPMAQVELPKEGQYESWRASVLAELRRVTFRYFPERIPPAQPEKTWLVSEPGIKIGLPTASKPVLGEKPARILLFVRSSESSQPAMNSVRESRDQLYGCEPRGLGSTRWTQKNPPNYVERSHALLGRTVDTGRIWDIIATARYLHAQHRDIPLYVAGEGPGAVLAAYAALLEPDIAGVIAIDPPISHMDAKAPQFLNVLRVCDIPDVFGMLAPRPLTLRGWSGDAAAKVAGIYAAAGASDKLHQEP